MTKLEASLLDILKEDCRIPLEKMAVMTGTSLEEVAAAIDSLESGQCTAHSGIGFHFRMLVSLNVVVNIVAVVEHRDVVGLPVDRCSDSVGTLGISSGGTHLGPPVVEGLVVEPVGVVIELEKELAAGQHVRWIRVGHVRRALVQLGELITAG